MFLPTFSSDPAALKSKVLQTITGLDALDDVSLAFIFRCRIDPSIGGPPTIPVFLMGFSNLFKWGRTWGYNSTDRG